MQLLKRLPVGRHLHILALLDHLQLVGFILMIHISINKYVVHLYWFWLTVVLSRNSDVQKVTHLVQSARVPSLHLQIDLLFSPSVQQEQSFLSRVLTWKQPTHGFGQFLWKAHFDQLHAQPPGPLHSLWSPCDRNSGSYSSNPSGHIQLDWSILKPEKYQHDYHSHNDDYETNHHHPNDMKTLRANPLSEVGIAVIAAAAFSLSPVPGKDCCKWW